LVHVLIRLRRNARLSATAKPRLDRVDPRARAVTIHRHKGLRDQKRKRLRQRLEDVALDPFTRQGFDATTVEEIDAAG
jgi:hypothetical protein